MITRRALVGGLAVSAGGVLLAGCDRLNRSPDFRETLRLGERLSYRVQRLITDRSALAREYRPEQRSPIFRANGTRRPSGPAYAAHASASFADWRLLIDGLVARPQAFTMASLRSMPRRAQITRHDCVEGWSAIGKWTGVPLKILLDQVRPHNGARFAVFHCADTFGSVPYYESIDLIDAYHPQTILAWALNDRLLPIENGAPLRLRVERMLGYKHAKYVERIEMVDDLSSVGGGRGGYWEDSNDYEWYAGI